MPTAPPSAGKDSTVLIVGAGMAGLAAARRLRQQGIAVILLEARDRLGGRTWTDQTWPDAPVDMGASWIHGVRGNPVSDLVDEFGVATAVTDYDNAAVYDDNGRELDDEEIEEIESGYAELLEEVYEYGEEREEDTTMGAILDKVIADNELDANERRLAYFAFNFAIEQEYAADIDELSVWYGEYGEVFGGDDAIFPDGYIQLVERLAEGVDIRLNHIVSAIAHTNEGVTVTTDQGTFNADYALVTLPLGVLQQDRVNFSPSLPDKKQQAIRDLGMGLLNKAYLRFTEPFWDTDVEFLGHIAAEKGKWALWMNIHHYTGEPILLGFNVATYARSLENLSDEATVADAMRTLRTIYGDGIPEPQSWLITRWASDPFAGGSYSFVPPHADRKTYKAMADPVNGRLFFAGEATEPDYPATVHGAILSGYREAERIGDKVNG